MVIKPEIVFNLFNRRDRGEFTNIKEKSCDSNLSASNSFFGDSSFILPLLINHRFHKVPSLISQIKSINDLSYQVIGVAMQIHSDLGPGLLESTYKECLRFSLQSDGLNVQSEKAVPLIYRDVKLDIGYRIDLLVEDRLVIEVEAVEHLNDVHFAQVLTYLKLGNFNLGLLINFNVQSLTDGIRRIINGSIDDSEFYRL